MTVSELIYALIFGAAGGMVGALITTVLPKYISYRLWLRRTRADYRSRMTGQAKGER